MNQNELNLQKDVEAIGRIEAVNNILEVVCSTTGMGLAAIARITEDRWIACAVRDLINFGLAPGDELKIETTICNEIRDTGKLVVIDHVDLDKHYANHHTPFTYGFQSYISVPIVLKSGRFFGTLCAINPKPAILNTKETIGMFNLFAELIAFHVDAQEQIEQAAHSLNEERQTSELRDQFIAILGHDLRNPVGAVLNAAQVLQRMPLDDRAKRLASIVQNSSYRMKALIDNILDFARGRLGDGITLERKGNEPMEEILGQVITELKMVWPEREIKVDLNFKEPVNSDGTRIAQLFSNLLSNALSHGFKDTPVVVSATSENGNFNLCVTNSGEPIPASAMERLFRPFSRGEVKPGQQGLGLGLYIASEIANAHKGSLKVDSLEGQTTFTLVFPNHIMYHP